MRRHEIEVGHSKSSNGSNKNPSGTLSSRLLCLSKLLWADLKVGEIHMPNIWTESEIQRYIDDEEEESLTLDYKAASALAKSDGKKTEIAIAVSAMANSAGGIIIYGLREHPTARHKAEKLDPHAVL